MTLTAAPSGSACRRSRAASPDLSFPIRKTAGPRRPMFGRRIF
jgi:hypothetical protein